MKKFFTLSLCMLMLASSLIGCNKAETSTTPDAEQGEETVVASTVKFGAGLYVGTPAVTDATEDKDGTGKLDVTVAAVTVDAEGKIVSCELDTASNTVSFTADGKAVASEGFMTKYEQGDAYNMVAYGGAVSEWYAQADAFEALVTGKTLDEVKALVAEANKGTEEVINAGCTIMIHEFVGAIEDAYNNAATEVNADFALDVNVATEQTCTDATEEKDGTNKLAVNVFASAVDADGKIAAASSDCVEVEFTFDMTGVSTLDTTKPVVSKKDKGADYGMVAYGGAALEWFEQAAAFDSVCVGKTPAEIAGLVGEDGRGTSDVQSAGCTIYVTGFVKAATK